MTQFGGLLVHFHGLFLVGFHALTSPIHAAQIHMGFRMAQRGGFFKPGKGFLIVAFAQIAEVMEHPHSVDAGHFAQLGRLHKPVVGSLQILLHAHALKIHHTHFAHGHAVAALSSGQQVGKVALSGGFGSFSGALRHGEGSGQQQQGCQQQRNQLFHGSFILSDIASAGRANAHLRPMALHQRFAAQSRITSQILSAA